jgi:hypothetical protein
VEDRAAWLHVDTEHRFASCLADAADHDIPVTARTYLDVAFFHPYDDGNARLAGLVSGRSCSG